MPHPHPQEILICSVRGGVWVFSETTLVTLNFFYLVCFSYVAGCPSTLQLFMKMIDDLCAMTDDELQLVVE